jgi:hypothetical protein
MSDAIVLARLTLGPRVLARPRCDIFERHTEYLLYAAEFPLFLLENAALHNKSQIDTLSRSCHTFVVRLKSDEETRYMATTQLSELEQRHRMLEDEIAEELQHPSTDDFKLAELKRRKLQVKDEIARLKSDAGVSVH